MSGGAGEAAVIVGSGALCAVGGGLRQVEASVRAGIGGQAESSIMNRWFEPMTLALVPEDALEPLEASLEPLAWTAAARRMLRLAAPALREAVAALPDPSLEVSLFIGLPEPRPNAVAPEGPSFAQALLTQSGLMMNLAGTETFPLGRAAALLALDAGLRYLAERRSQWVIVGGADTYLDLARLGELDAEQRILGQRVMDGFIPGEAAAFTLLTTAQNARQRSLEAPVRVLGVGTALDPGHLYGAEPARGEGLSNAIDALMAKCGPPPRPIRNTYAGLNGESFGAKEWGVARLRHTDSFAADARIQHPADSYGDVGAATGALLLGLAEASLRRDDRQGPVLVWSSSDREPCACTLLTTQP